MSFSAWKIWLHPRLTRRVLNDLERAAESAGNSLTELEGVRNERESAIRERDQALAQRDQARSELDERATLLSNARREVETLRRQIEDLHSEIEEMHSEIEEMRDIDARLQEYADITERAEQMKIRYENKIRQLHQQLRQAGALGYRRIESDIVTDDDIDQIPSQPSQSSKSSKSPQSAQSAQSAQSPKSPQEPLDDNWLQPLDI